MDTLEGMEEGLHKSRSGLIRALVKVEQDRIADIIISGDFILTPEHFIDDMEQSLVGAEAQRGVILNILEKFYAENDFQSPETFPKDFTEAIMKAIEGDRNG